ncbi:hypothetical protein ACFCX4_19285 [Kitasatospora sp. NPDC056327]|uniref:hypothetical protein n=1 Tax=Kitasatospora sp. NPDC056327 TaxID=3345785 RepID=UPI0035DC8833
MLTLRLIRREARVAWPVAAVLGLLAVLLTAVPLSWPPRLDRLAAGTLADRVDRAQLSGAMLSARAATIPLTPPPDADGTLDRDLDSVGEALRAAAGPVAAALGRPRARAATPHAPAPELPQFYGAAPEFALVHAQPDGTGGPVEYVEGRAPQPPGTAPDAQGPSGEPPAVEVAVSEGTRDRIGLPAGRRFRLAGDGLSAPLVVTGVFRTDHGADRIWTQSPMLVAPWTVIRRDGGRNLAGELLTTAGAIERLAGGGAGLVAAWELPVTVDRSGPAATRAAIDRTRSALAGWRAAPQERLCGTGAGCTVARQWVDVITVAERLTPELDGFAAQRLRTEQLQGFALAGVLAVVVATAVAAARLGARRRAGAFALQLSRGARLSGIAGRMLAEAAVAVGAGVAAGWVLGRALAPPGAGLGSPVPVLVAALLVWCAPAVVLLASAGRSGPLPPSRRLVLEGLVLLLAVGGVVALRSRGAYAGSGIDPQLALAPVLLALVVVLLLLRLLPPLLSAATRWARRSRGLVPLVALAGAGRQSGAAALALLVLVLATGYGVYGATIPRTVGAGQARLAEWRTGGAPFALVGPRDRLSGDLDRLPGQVRRVAVTGASGELIAQEDGTTVGGAQFVGVDADGLRAANPSSPVARALTAAPGTAAPVEWTGADHEVPVLTALADPALAARFPGGTFELSAPGTGRVLVRVLGALPGEALRDPLLGPVLGDRDRPPALLLFTGPSAERLPVQKNHPSALLLHSAAAGPGSDPAAVRTAVRHLTAPTGEPGQRVELRDRAGQLEALRGDGLARSLRLAFLVTTGTGLLLGLGAFALDLLLSAAERARTTSRLRTLGTGSRAVFALQLVQVVPLLLSAAVGGTALGLLLPAVLGAGLRLGPITGGPFEPAVHIDWTAVAGLGLALALLMTAAAVLEAAIGRRRGLGAVLRLGEAL